jgi:Transposase DDE domain
MNYTCTNMSEHTSLSHDKITRFLSSNPMSEHHFYEQVYFDKPLVSGGYLIFDDTVLDKSHSHQIDMVRKQYSGNVGGVIKGIGIVNMLYYTPQDERWYLLGYRVFDPDIDNKSKVDHVSELIKEAESQCITYVGVLMDTWYAVSSLFQLVNSYGKYFYCPIKNNRLVKQTKDTEFVSVSELSWTTKQLQFGQDIKVKNLNMNVRIFKVIVSTNRTDFVLTNDLTTNSVESISNKQKIRWKIECLHRELKQLTGIAKCQCRKALSQRTHIFCAMLVWNKIKEMAYQTYSTAYQIKNQPFKNYLTEQLNLNCPVFA